MSSAAVPADPHSDDPRDGDPQSGDPAGSSDPAASLRRAEQVVDAFVGVRRRRAVLDAEEIRVLARADALIGEPLGEGRSTARSREIARRAMVADLATAARVSEWTVTRLLGQCADLCERFAPAVEALARGEVSRPHVLAIHDAGVRRWPPRGS